MTNTTDLLRLPKGFDSSDPVDGNPFTEGDPRNGFWARATLEAEQESCLLNAAFMQSWPFAREEIIPWQMAFLASRYDVWSRRGVHVIVSTEQLGDWDQWLANYANRILNTFRSFSPSEVALEKLREWVLGSREHWRAEGRRCVAFQKTHQAGLAVSKSDAAALALTLGSPESSANAVTTMDTAISEKPAVRANAVTWEEIEISFISDERVQVKVGHQLQTCNYAEMGFADRRSNKPNQGWGMLRAMAQARGVISNPARNSKDFIAMAKRIERVRGTLRAHFQMDSDPIPLDPVSGYSTRFKLGRAISFDK